MKKILAHLITLTCFSATAQNALQGKWLVTLQHSDIGSVRTFMQFDTGEGSFEAYTRPKADKAILGGTTALLGRTFTKSFKNGCLLRVINGTTRMSGDTLKLSGIFVSAIGNYYFDGHVSKGQLYARLSNKMRKQVGSVQGTQNLPAAPLENYSALFEKALALTEQKVFNASVTRSGDWKKFVHKGEKVSARVQDDLEMVFAFFYYAGKLPVSHYALMKPLQDKYGKSDQHEKYVFIEEKDPGTAYMRITSFSGTAAEMDSAFAYIGSKGYKRLIVDLRDNTGGTVEAGMAFARNVTDTAFYGGVFLTQKWFSQHAQPPTINDYTQFRHFSDASFDLIIQGIHETEGLCLKVMPGRHVYKGRLYVLTNRNTASTCEPLVYGLKQQKRAVIVGETTAGAMLNGEFFALDKGFQLVVPTADYYAVDGYHIDKKGVKPDVEVRQEEALDYVLKNMK